MARCVSAITSNYDAVITPTCAKLSDYLNQILAMTAQVDPVAWAADPGTLVVPDAGEQLYRLR